jgi:hypothetical protein
LVVLSGFIASMFSLCSAICGSLASLFFISLSLRFVFFVAFCHNMILCSLCTNLARFWRLMI